MRMYVVEQKPPQGRRRKKIGRGGGHFLGGGNSCFGLGGAHPCTRVSEGGGDYLLVGGLVEG